MTGPVVVGFDGSPASVTAAWWAAREAVDRHLPVLLLHSWATQPLDVPVAQEAPGKQHYGGRVLQQREAELLHRHVSLSPAPELVSNPASRALVEAGDRATMLVLGGRIPAWLRQPARPGRGPVPRSDRPGGRSRRRGRQESPRGNRPAGGSRRRPGPLAGRRSATGVRLLRSRVVRSPGARGPGAAAVIPGDAPTLAPWQEKFPEVDVVDHVARGSAAQVLPAVSAHSRLTVVGRRCHPSPLTWKLGPVAHAAPHHLPCPVAVVPHD